MAKKAPAKKTAKKAKKKVAPKKIVKATLKAVPTVVGTVLEPDTSKKPWAERNYIGIRLFSGAPNPRWEITPQVVTQVLAELLALPKIGSEMDFPDEGALYGGIVVHLITRDLRRRGFLLFDQTVLDYDEKATRRDADRKLEAKLFKTMPVELNMSLDSLSFETASTPDIGRHNVVGATAGEHTPHCGGAPNFEAPPPLSRWDKFPGIEDNNCYNYANNVFSGIDDAQPGRRMFAAMTVEEMHQRLLSDHLVPAAPNRKHVPAGCHPTQGANLIAVAMRRRSGQKMENGQQVPMFKDFHCFRLDANGQWSHKDGPRRSRNTDKDHHVITDLALANLNSEHVLVGYYWSVPGVRHIGMPHI